MNRLRSNDARRTPFLLALSLLVLLCCPALAMPGMVTLLRTPNGGLQPQGAVDSRGILHLIYFQGSPERGDIFYVHKKLGSGGPFSAPIRVNSAPGSAMAVGTIRGAQMAVGRDSRIHVSWNGVGAKGANGYPSLFAAYTRLNDAGTAFEPQRNLLGPGESVDGGGSVAADATGRVYITWHASPKGQDEAAGAVYLARSADDGRTFTRGLRISVPSGGQCGCCSMRAFVDHTGTLSILYRAAGGGFDRDSTLLVSGDGGRTFRSAVLGRWKLGACPMTSFSLSEGPAGVVGAWETAGQVYFAGLQHSQTATPRAAPGTGSRKYPVAVAGPTGKTLFAWVEGAGWQRGGSLAWQIYDRDGSSEGAAGRADGVPTWSLVTAVARPDGGFVVIY